MNESDDKIKILQNTLDILKKGYYRKHGKKKKLKLSRERMGEAYVLLPDEVKKYSNVPDFKPVFAPNERCIYGIQNIDSFSLTRKIYKDYADLFDKAINTLNYNGYNCNKLFRRIDFAVLSNDKEQYNYKEFYRNFNSEKEYQSKLKG